MTAPHTNAIRAIIERDGCWWVPLTTYLAEYPGETAEAVYSRRAKGIWQDGVHCKFIKGGGLWIDIVAVNTWAAKSESRRVSRRDSTEQEKRSASA